jgi:hypothetical protein
MPPKYRSLHSIAAASFNAVSPRHELFVTYLMASPMTLMCSESGLVSNLSGPFSPNAKTAFSAKDATD